MRETNMEEYRKAVAMVNLTEKMGKVFFELKKHPEEKTETMLIEELGNIVLSINSLFGKEQAIKMVGAFIVMTPEKAQKIKSLMEKWLPESKKPRAGKIPLSTRNQNIIIKDQLIEGLQGVELLKIGPYGNLEGVEGEILGKNKNRIKYATDLIKEIIKKEAPIYKMTKEDIKNIFTLYKFLEDDKYFPEDKQEFTGGQFFQRLNLGGNHKKFIKTREGHLEKLNSILETMEKFRGITFKIQLPLKDVEYDAYLIPPYKIERTISDKTDFKITLDRDFTMLSYFLAEGRIREKGLYQVAAPGKKGSKKDLVIESIEGRITQKLKNGGKVNNIILMSKLIEIYNSKSWSSKRRVKDIAEEYLDRAVKIGIIKSYEIENGRIVFL